MAAGYVIYQIVGGKGAENLEIALVRAGNIVLEVEIADNAVSRA